MKENKKVRKAGAGKLIVLCVDREETYVSSATRQRTIVHLFDRETYLLYIIYLRVAVS